MKIVSNSLSPYKKIFDSIKQPGVQLFDSVFLDFSRSQCVFMNETSFVRISFEIDGEVPEDQENFFVDGNKFFVLISTYDLLEIKGRSFFSPEGDKFVLSSFKEEFDLPEFGGEDWTSINFDFNKDFSKKIRDALDFIDPDDPNASSLFFENNTILSLSKVRYFQTPMKEINESFNLPYDFVRIASSLSMEGDATIQYREINDAFVVYFHLGSLEFLLTTNSSNSLPVDPSDEEFREGFFHPYYIVISTKSFLNSIKFLSTFLSDSHAAHTQIRVHSEKDSSSYLEFYIHNENEVSYKTELESLSDPEYFNGKSFWIALESLKKILVTFDNNGSKSVLLRYEDEKPAIYITDVSELEKEEPNKFFIVQTLLEDPME